MRKKCLFAALLLACTAAAAGCNSSPKETEAPKQEAQQDQTAAPQSEAVTAETAETELLTSAAEGVETLMTEEAAFAAGLSETEVDLPAETETETEWDYYFDFDETESEGIYYIDLFDETEGYEDYSDYFETESETEPVVIPRPDFEVSDYLVIEDDAYRNMTIQVAPAQQVSDEEIQAEISDSFYYLDEYDDLVVKKTEGTVEDGDLANIDYVGKKDGVAFDGGTAEAYDLEIGSGSFIEGFEEGLIGKEIGSTVDLNLTFPEDYGSEELAGADVVFTVTINYVSEMPEMTDDLAEKLSDGEFTGADEYVESLRSDLQSEYDEEQQHEAYSAIIMKLMDLYPIENYPQANVDYYVDLIISEYFVPYASMYGMSVDDFVSMMYEGLTMDEVKEQEIVPSAKQYVAQEILLGAVAEKEGITMTDEELQEVLQGYADDYGITVDELLEGQDMGSVRVNELDQRVIEWLYANVNIEEVEETEDDLLPDFGTEAELLFDETEA